MISAAESKGLLELFPVIRVLACAGASICIVALQVQKHLAENSQVGHRTLEDAAGSDNAGDLLQRRLQSIHVVDVLERM
jgi:hypothetical protein